MFVSAATSTLGMLQPHGTAVMFLLGSGIYMVYFGTTENSVHY